VVPEEEIARRLHSRSIYSLCATGHSVGPHRGAACPQCGGRLLPRTDDNETADLEP